MLISCNNENAIQKTAAKSLQKNKFYHIYSAYSRLKNTYSGFNSPKAVNKIAEFENDYFNNYDDSITKYYGTEWARDASADTAKGKNITIFDEYKKELEKYHIKPDSFHCTIYAVKALEAGMERNFEKLKQYHKQIWKNREFAGWSIGYILTEKFGWRAYLVIDRNSEEYKRCLSNFKNHRNYWVWKQPSIRLENMFIVGESDSIISKLLSENEFGWGFSDQGIHTWITNFELLKECIWDGAPAKKYDLYSGNPLFKKGYFLSSHDYSSRVLILPPKQ
jgi:hypothetical protein